MALGGCSFEAYNDPEVSDGLGETTPSGSKILYADKSFLLERMAGLLELTVKSATNLPVADVSRQQHASAGFPCLPETPPPHASACKTGTPFPSPPCACADVAGQERPLLHRAAGRQLRHDACHQQQPQPGVGGDLLPLCQVSGGGLHRAVDSI